MRCTLLAALAGASSRAAAAAGAAVGACPPIEKDVEYAGSDISGGKPADSIAACCTLCDTVPGCTAVSWSGNGTDRLCRLKSSSVGRRAKKGEQSARLRPDLLNGHALRLDDSGRIVGWMERSTAMDRFVRSSLGWIARNAPVAPNGLMAYYTYPVYPVRDYPFEPTTMFTRWCWAAAAFFMYSGEDGLVREGERMLEYLIANGTMPDDPTWAWRRVPYASSDGGALRYRGASGEDHYGYGCSYGKPPGPGPGYDQPGFRNKRCTMGHGDGYGVIETDKVAAAGSAYVLYWKLTANPRLLDAAVACAAALVQHVTPGNVTHSPWPYRVFAETGTVREAYTSHVIAAVRLFDELLQLDAAGRLPPGADTAGMAAARAAAWAWMMAYPMRNGAWCNFCEDIPVQDMNAEIAASGSCNYNSITPMIVARYILEHPGVDAEWRAHVPTLIRFIEEKLVRGLNRTGEPSVAWGANTVSEQVLDTDKMSIHTVRYAATQALWADAISLDPDGAGRAREALATAQRSWDWSSYTLGSDGVVAVTPYTAGESDMWFNIQVGVAYYTLHMMGSNPLWAPPNQTHLLRSTSVVTRVALAGSELAYTTFDARAVDRLRVAPGFARAGLPAPAAPAVAVSAGGQRLPRVAAAELRRAGAVGWALDAATLVLDVAHNDSDIRVLGGAAACAGVAD